MRPDRLLLQDMLDAIDEVLACTPPAQSAFDGDKFLRSHLLRHIQIIGEAAARVSTAVQDAHPEVPWRLITGMRHVLVHNYFEVNWARVYLTARDHIPPLRPTIAAILASLPPGPP